MRVCVCGSKVWAQQVVPLWVPKGLTTRIKHGAAAAYEQHLYRTSLMSARARVNLTLEEDLGSSTWPVSILPMKIHSPGWARLMPVL